MRDEMWCDVKGMQVQKCLPLISNPLTGTNTLSNPKSREHAKLQRNKAQELMSLQPVCLTDMEKGQSLNVKVGPLDYFKKLVSKRRMKCVKHAESQKVHRRMNMKIQHLVHCWSFVDAVSVIRDRLWQEYRWRCWQQFSFNTKPRRLVQGWKHF